MSAPLAGKFQDHYEVLGIDPKAISETIQRAYAQLAKKYHPNTPGTGDPEKFEALNLAYEVLSDPELRASFDKVKGVGHEEGPPKFSGQEFFDALGRETVLRSALLCVLYDRRHKNPYKPSISMRHIEGILEANTEEMTTALWYLKQRGLVVSDDKSSLQITVDGMDFLESHRPSPEEVMPLIKDSAVGGSQTKPASPPRVASETESMLSVLSQSLARV